MLPCFKHKVNSEIGNHNAGHSQEESFASTLLLMITPAKSTVDSLYQDGNNQDKKQQLEEK